MNTPNEKINVGCGSSPSKGWLNLDNSPSITIANSPLLFFILKKFHILSKKHINYINWLKSNSIVFADATKRIPVRDSSASVVYSSHMIEHLSQRGLAKFLAEAKRVLAPKGVLRISVPDLDFHIKKYGIDGNANAFMKSVTETVPKVDTLKERIIFLIAGYRNHQWMYNSASLKSILLKAGFKDVEQVNPGTTKIQDYAGLNLYEREENSLILEGIKP